MLWAYRVLADIEQQERLDSPDSEVFATLRKLGGIPARGFPAPDKELGVELMSFAWLHEVTEQASSDALEQVCRDCRAIDRLAAAARTINWHAAQPSIQSAVRSVTGDLPEPPSVLARKEARKRLPVPVIVRFFLSAWENLNIRAALIPALIVIRQSPEHGKRLTEILALAAWWLELAQQLPKPER
jgi:hypothetical protein